MLDDEIVRVKSGLARANLFYDRRGVVVFFDEGLFSEAEAFVLAERALGNAPRGVCPREVVIQPGRCQGDTPFVWLF